MAKTMRLDVVSAKESLFSGEVEEIFVAGTMGDLGITPGHSQLISTLKPGELRYAVDGSQVSLFVSGGIMEVQPNVVTILADTAIRAEDLDEKEAQSAMDRANTAMEGKDPEDTDYASALIELEAAKMQIQMIQKMGKTLHS